MVEREPRRELLPRGILQYLWHPGTPDVFSGYGLTVDSGHPEHLVGLLMVDRPIPADPSWLQNIAGTFGECQLLPMSIRGERGLACQMRIPHDSVPYLRQFPAPHTPALQQALRPFLEHPPKPTLRLKWDENQRLWLSEFALENILPPVIRQLFTRAGYGCLAIESDRGILHLCHAADRDIAGFKDKPVRT